MKMKKALSAALAILLFSTVFVGCDAESGAATGTGAAAAIDTTKKPELKVLMNYMNNDPNTNYVAKLVEEETGYKVNYSLLPAQDILVKLNVIISSKEDFDIFVLSKGDFDNTVGTGAYLELNNLLPKYAPDLQKKTNANLWSNVNINGKTMGIPEATAYESVGPAYRVRTDMLKKAGISKLPTNLDEFYAALKALKANNVIPVTANTSNVAEIYSAFGLSGEQSWYVVDDKLVHRVEMPQIKEYITYMNKLFTEGLIDSEWATNTTDNIREKFYSGKAAMYRIAWWDEPVATKTINEKQPGSEVAYLPYLKNANGDAYAAINRGVNRVMVVPKVSKNAEYALDFMNAKVKDDEVYRRLVIGDIDVDIKKDANGDFEPILPTFTEHMNDGDKFQNGSITEAYSKYWLQTRVRKDPTLYKEFLNIQDNAKQATIHYDPQTFMSPNLEYSKVLPKVTKFTEDSFLQFITGARPLSDWDKFVTEWKQEGGDEATRLINEWYNENKSTLEGNLIKKK